MSNILHEIFEYKKQFIEKQKQIVSLEEMICNAQQSKYQQNFNFVKAIEDKINAGQVAIIAEIKQASPSRGLIVKNSFVPAQIAKSYIEGECACISVLTDEKYFMGSTQHLTDVAAVAAATPLLQKDFVVDQYQIYEAKALGASCILLIMSYLEINIAIKFERLAHSLGLDVLCECHNLAEVELAQKHLQTRLIGINNRNLSNFLIDTNNTANLFEAASKNNKIVVCESGIETAEQIAKLTKIGCHSFLIGTSLITSPNPTQKIKELALGVFNKTP